MSYLKRAWRSLSAWGTADAHARDRVADMRGKRCLREIDRKRFAREEILNRYDDS